MTPAYSSFSLRARIFGTIAAVLSMIAATAVWAIVSLNDTLHEFDRMIGQSAYRLEAAVRLQTRVLGAESIAGSGQQAPAGTRRVALANDARAVEGLFREMLDGNALRPRERALIERARREWRQDLARQGENPDLSAGATGQASRLLGTLTDSYRQESEKLREELDLGRQRLSWVVAALVAGCLFIAVVGGGVLARLVLQPLRMLKQGVAHFADNDLSYRVPVVGGNEFGQLAGEINWMAEQLKVRQKELEDLSAHDPLTGLFNRREFTRRLLNERERAQRYGKVFTLIMVDIDHFKDINDSHGHPAGDEVLTTIADLLRVSVRPMDVVCRYGGEEFAILLPETASEGALSLAERIRRTVADSMIAVNTGKIVRATVSMGLAAFDGKTASETDPLAVADKALYRAKHGGRNQVVSDPGA